MTFATPALLTALGLLVPVLVAFLVRRRHEVLRVPSTLIWRLGARTVAPSRRVRRLRRLAALLACLLGVAALVVGAAGPTPWSPGSTTVFVVDASASMSAGGVDAPIARARRWAARRIAAAGPRDRFAVVLAGETPRIAAPVVPAGPELDEGLAAIAAGSGGADLGAAVALARALAQRETAPRAVIVLGDASPDLVPPATETGPLALYAVTFPPTARDNLGITTLATGAPADARSEDEREALVGIATASDVPRRARVSVSVDEDVLLDRVVDVPAQGTAEVRVGLRGGGRVRARVRPEDGRGDAVALDDEATLVEPARRVPRVWMAVARKDKDADDALEPGRFFVEKALGALGVTDRRTFDPSEAPSEVAPGDVLVALEEAPQHRVDMPTLFVGTHLGTLPMAVRQMDPGALRLRSMDGQSPILRGVALDGITIAKAFAGAPTGDARALVDLDGGSVVVTGGTGPGAWVWLGVDPAASDLVLRVGFPVLVANALAHLAGAAQVMEAPAVPRAEVALGRAEPPPVPLPEPPARRGLPATPAVMLAALGAALLALEAWLTHRKGWAS